MALGRHTHILGTPKNEEFLLHAKLKGAGAAALTKNEPFTWASEVDTITRSSLGVFALTFKHKYPELVELFEPVVKTSTNGLRVRWSAIDVAAGTATLRCEREGDGVTPAWTTGVAVSSNTATLTTAGWVVAVDIPAGGVTGAGNLRSTAAATSRDVRVVYDAGGIATISTLAGDAVTAVAVAVIPLTQVADPQTTDDIYLSWIVRNRKD